MNNELLAYSDLALSVRPGRYRHFKGGEYQVLGIAKHSEDLNAEFVVYKNIQTNQLWIRPLEMFLENVDQNGYTGPRFAYIDQL